MKKVLFVILTIFILSNTVFAHELLNSSFNDFNGFKYTVAETSKLTKSGNPMDYVIAFKEMHDNKFDGVVLNPTEGYGGDYYLDEDSNINDYEKNMINKMADVTNIMFANIRNGVIPQSQHDAVDEGRKNINMKHVIGSIIVFIVFVLLFIFMHKKIFIILSVCVLIFGILNYVNISKNVQIIESISNYALTGEIDSHLSKNIDSNGNKDKLMKFMDQKWSIGKLINDLLIKIDWCNNMYLNGISITDENYELMADEYDSENTAVKKEFSNTPLMKYTYKSIDNWEFNNSSILLNGLWIENMQTLTNKIKSSNYNFEFVNNELMEKCTYNNINDKNILEEPLFRYVNRIIHHTYIENDNDNVNNYVISYFKDWYIEGTEDKDVDLPYGVTLHYEAPKFIKKDIKEVLYTNESELDHNSKERQVYVMYYKDSKGELKGTYTDIEFVKTGNDYVIDFNPYELLYDLKKPVATLTIK